MVLDIRGTNVAGQAWLDGRFEGKQGRLVTVVDAGNQENSYGLVKVLPDEPLEYRIPMRYLEPHEPVMGDFAVILSGPHTGERGKVVNLGDGPMLEGEGGFRPLSACQKATYLQ